MNYEILKTYEKNQNAKDCSTCEYGKVKPNKEPCKECIAISGCFTKWEPKQIAKYRFHFEDGYDYTCDKWLDSEQLIDQVRQHGKVTIELNEE